MIYEALELIRTELRAYFESMPSIPPPEVLLGSITDGAGQHAERLVVSLVNVQEEATLKNLSPYQRNATGGFDVVNPPVFLNLFVLVSANYSDPASYGSALKRLAQVVQCFQRKKELSVATNPFGSPETMQGDSAAQLRLLLDLYSPTFEQVSQLWGTLGGRQVPFALYKVRLVQEQAREVLLHGPEIERIERRYTL